jgi:RHS repeat-associated protein
VHFEWDARGLLSAEQALTGANGHASSQPQRIEHSYDGLGTRTQTRLPDGRHLNYLHYGSGHLHQVNLDGRVLTDIERDQLHRQTQRRQGLLQSQYSYDAAGRLIGQAASASTGKAQLVIRPLIERHYRYDAAGQLLTRAGTGGGARYTYDPIGRLLAAVHDQGHSQHTERFAFDPASNLIDDARIQQAQAQVKARAQDSRSERQREEDEWAETVKRRLADPSFDLLGYQSPRIPDRPPGAWAGNRLLVYEDKRFAWDRHGNLLAKKSGRHQEQHFAYDAQGQLTHVLTRSGLGSATAREQLSEYGYDALGRRVVKRVWPAQALRQNGSAPQEQTLPAPSFAPPKGQPHTSSYLWAGNRLLQEITPGALRTYVFEPDSFIPMLRIDDARSQEQDHQILQKQELLALDTQAQEALSASNPDGEDADDFAALKARAWGQMVPGQVQQHLAGLRHQAEQLQHAHKAPQARPSRILHYHCDHLGTPRELTDEDGKLVWSASYWAWGKLRNPKGRSGGAGTDIASPDAPRNQFWHTRTQPGRSNHLPEWVADNAGSLKRWRELKDAEEPQNTPEAANDPSVWGEPTDQSIRFQGQWHDPETGLHYNRFRYYDPDVGRFIHQDPIGLLGGQNLYQYAPNPINWVDVLGLKHTAVWALYDKSGKLKAEGIEYSGCDKKPGRRLTFPEQLQTHTEVKIMKKIEGVVAQGDVLTILGERPPCNPGGRGCQAAMDAFARKHGIDIRYMNMSDSWKFPNKCPCGDPCKK